MTRARPWIRRCRRGLDRTLVAMIAIAWAGSVGCSREPIEPSPEISIDGDDVVHDVLPPESVVVAAATASEPARRVEPALRRDDDAGATLVRARRLVFRFTMRLPFGLGAGRPDLAPPAGELRVDIAGKRLRAQFVGTGFPVDDGSEVRMRVDLPGTYVFDGRGGRPVSTGQLAAWFQSGPGARGVELVVRDSSPDDHHVIDLVCRLFGEWAGTSIATVRRACAADGMPTRMTFGPYRVDRTAEATIDVLERALRTDHVDPPPGLTHLPSIAFHSPEVLARLVPSVDDPPERRARAGEVPVVVTDGLRVENRTGARVLLSVDGVALGWLDSGIEPSSFPGIPAGGHVVGAMMPLGGSASRGRAYRLPANIVLERSLPPPPRPPR